MCIVDEKQEAVARIRMAVDSDRKARLDIDLAEEEELGLELETSGKTWRLGSPEGKKINLYAMALNLAKTDRQYHHLDKRLRDFIACNMPGEAVQIRYEDDIPVSLDFNQSYCLARLIFWQAQRYKCIVLKYQSVEDWTERVDIVRCNPRFHGQRRFDCAIIHDDAQQLSVARLHDLIRVWLPSGTILDLALVHRLSRSKWKPRTTWDGCRVLDEEADTTLVQVDYLLRGSLVCPVSERDGEKTHYFVDSVDPDIFLRENLNL